ncbi:kinase-like protein [Xylariaceae sp. FL0255]|nr:kinase-like protein [Xylariaceae sp. FL0255]
MAKRIISAPQLQLDEKIGELGPLAFAEYVQKNFQSRYWEYEKLLGRGGFGIAVLMKQHDRLGPPGQRVAVKLARARGAAELKKEIDILKQLNGAAHIVSIQGSCDDLAQTVKDRRSGLLPKLNGNSRQGVRILTSFLFESFVGVEGPAVALEYLECGDALGLYRKLANRKPRRNVPNRVLWSFLLCLARATTGIAYPIGAPIGSTPVTERIPLSGDQSNESPLQHNDLFNRNIMLTVSDGVQEHGIGAVAKLIDFGLAKDGGGSASNMLACAVILTGLITFRPLGNEPVIYKGSETRAGKLVGQNGIEPHPFPWLDPELRDILLRCLYLDIENRPSLREVLDIAEAAVLEKTATSFPNPVEETDEAVADFMQEFLLDVPRQMGLL